ncbi:MAG: hypothetical protein AAF558_00990 [Verrucomicrobiota bacterium]
MVRPKRTEVVCPSCGHRQMEYVEANSTFCHACGHRIPLTVKQYRKGSSSAKTSSVKRQSIRCFHCSHEMQIPTASDSWQCPRCSEYLDFKTHEISVSTGRLLLTYGNITINTRGYLGGSRAEAENITLAGGSASARLVARKELIVNQTCKLSGGFRTRDFVIKPGATAEAQKFVQCRNATIEGIAKFQEMFVSEHLEIVQGGALYVEHLVVSSVTVQQGGQLRASFAHCSETPPRPAEDEPLGTLAT